MDNILKLPISSTDIKNENKLLCLQREGGYPPPSAASNVLGLEAAGVIDDVGPGCSGWEVGDRVMALLQGNESLMHLVR